MKNTQKYKIGTVKNDKNNKKWINVKLPNNKNYFLLEKDANFLNKYYEYQKSHKFAKITDFT